MRARTGALLVLGLAFICGCDGAEGPEGETRRSGSRDVEISDNDVVLEHDFGLVMPEEQREHRFAIHNSTTRKWTLREVINVCACTATDLSAPGIAAGATEEVTVTYQTGSGSRGERRRVVLLFEEPGAPRVFLVIRAKIREPMTLSPPNVQFLDLGKGLARERLFEVQNFGESDWDSVVVEPTVSWLRTTVNEITFEAGEDLPRQIWRISVTADAADLSHGEHDARIAVEARAAASRLVREEPVHVRVTSAVNAVPSQFFFGQVRVGQPVKQTIKIRFTHDAVPASATEIVFEHNLGKQLGQEWLDSEGDQWELCARLTPRRDMDLSDAKIIMGFADPEMPTVDLPIYGVVTGTDQ